METEFVEILKFNGFTVSPDIPERLQPQYYAGLSRAKAELSQYDKDPLERMWKLQRAMDLMDLSRLIEQGLKS